MRFYCYWCFLGGKLVRLVRFDEFYHWECPVHTAFKIKDEDLAVMR